MNQLAQVRDIPPPPSLGGLRFYSAIGDPFDKPNLLEVVISRALLFAFVIAGIIFFFKLIAAGYSYLTSAGDSAKIQSASKSLVSALIGLIIVISSYFIAQIIEVVFNISFL